MPEPIADEQKQADAALLMGEQPKPVEEAKETTEETKEPEVKEQPELAAATPPKEEEEPKWNKSLTKAQQRIKTLEENDRKRDEFLRKQEEKLNKLLAYNGIEVDLPADPAPAAPADPRALPSEDEMERQMLRQKVEFLELRQKNPGFDPDKEWGESWKDALATYDIDEDATELPEGITRKALEKLADKNFQARLKAQKAPPSPTARPKPKTPSPAAPPIRHASHVPSSSNGQRLSATEIMRRDAAMLMGEDPG